MRPQVDFITAWRHIMAPGEHKQAVIGRTYKDALARAGPDDVAYALLALFEGEDLTQTQKIALVCARWLAQEDGRGCVGSRSSPGCHDRPGGSGLIVTWRER